MTDRTTEQPGDVEPPAKPTAKPPESNPWWAGDGGGPVTVDYPVAEGGEGWGGYAPPTPSAPPGRGSWRSQGPRTTLIVGLLAGLVGSGLGAGVVAVLDHKDSGSSSASVSALQPSATVAQTGSGQTSARPAGSIAAIAAAVLPSVVTVKENSSTVQGTGSGVVISGGNGLYVLTNNHVVSDVAGSTGSGALQIIPNGGSKADAVDATVVGTDALTDLAVLKPATTAGLKPATLGRSIALVIGDTVVAIGAPLGLDGTVTQGIVSATNRFFTVGDGSCTGTTTAYAGAIQTDAAINPGNSGGALVDASGRVVGINSAIATADTGLGSTQGGNIGVGFAIPIDEAAPIAQDIIRMGKATHPFLGVSSDDNAQPRGAKIQDQADPCSGKTVPGVTGGSPAAKAGLRAGDVVTKVDNSTIGGYEDLVTKIRQLRVGDTVTVTYVRGGQTRTTRVTLAERPTGS